jgi:hypothetical protein
MDDERKYAILFAATILSARKLMESMEENKPNMAKQFWVDKAIQEAEYILERIEQKDVSTKSKMCG